MKDLYCHKVQFSPLFPLQRANKNAAGWKYVALWYETIKRHPVSHRTIMLILATHYSLFSLFNHAPVTSTWISRQTSNTEFWEPLSPKQHSLSWINELMFLPQHRAALHEFMNVTHEPQAQFRSEHRYDCLGFKPEFRIPIAECTVKISNSSPHLQDTSGVTIKIPHIGKNYPSWNRKLKQGFMEV